VGRVVRSVGSVEIPRDGGHLHSVRDSWLGRILWDITEKREREALLRWHSQMGGNSQRSSNSVWPNLTKFSLQKALIFLQPFRSHWIWDLAFRSQSYDFLINDYSLLSGCSVLKKRKHFLF
jgi:hypothetical protein